MSAPTDAQRMEKIVSLCKRRGFIFQSSEIYGGLNGAWDYGPLGVELKRNLKNYWWRVMVHERDDVVGMDGAILTHPAVLKASGHVEGFTDPWWIVDDGQAIRADQIPAKWDGFDFEFARDATPSADASSTCSSADADPIQQDDNTSRTLLIGRIVERRNWLPALQRTRIDRQFFWISALSFEIHSRM